MSARNRELMALIPASLLLTAGFAAIFIQQSEQLSDVSLTYGAIFLLLCLAGHIVIRFTLPARRPVPLPAGQRARLLRARRDLPDRRGRWRASRRSGSWSGWSCSPARSCCCATSACSSATATRSRSPACCCCCCRACPGIGQQVNGAYLGVKLGPVAFQPAEFGKIAIIIFLAAYLRDTRQVLVQGRDAARRSRPAAQAPRAAARGLGRGDVHARVHPRPRLVADVLRRLPGAALRGHQPALVRGDRDGACSPLGAWFFASTVSHVQDRVDIWLDPFKPEWVEKEGYQIAQSVFAQADGGLFGTGLRGLAAARAGRRVADPGAAHRPHLRRDRQRGRARRRLRAAARLPAAGRARLQDRDDLGRLVLEAARHRA